MQTTITAPAWKLTLKNINFAFIAIIAIKNLCKIFLSKINVVLPVSSYSIIYTQN